MAKWLGIDFGSKRIGLAVSDPDETISTPADTISACGTVSEDVQSIARWAEKHEISAYVIGRPLNMDGTVGRQARIVDRVARELAQAVNAPVELWDERLSSFQADEYLDQAGVTSAKRKTLRDALAAHVILQSFLDARRRHNPNE